ncbi:MAG: tRNA pseudouridine(38-40) synthase TruA [Ilumatobacteraceae bacterium]
MNVKLRRARLTVAYDGTMFHGFAVNDGVRTVVGELREAIEKVVRQPVDLVGAGRTDAGVHGWGQVVSCDLPDDTDLEMLVRRVNRMCGPAIVARAAAWASNPDFSARFTAKWRHYRYDIWNAPQPNAFLAPMSWHVFQPLSMPALRLTCDPLIGEHDFSSFCRRPRAVPGQSEPSMRRNVMLAKWSEVSTDYGPGLLRFEIRANAFCHQMVRAIVGTMVDTAAGRLPAGEIRGLLMAKDRQEAGQVAPAHGLCLWEVGYE